MGKDTKITFTCEEEMAELIGKVAFESDRNKSEVIRACVIMSVESVRVMPSLTNRLSMEDRRDSKINAL